MLILKKNRKTIPYDMRGTPFITIADLQMGWFG